MEKTNSNMKNLSYLLIGGGIGATLALLFAPKSGSEMREDISYAANNGLQKTKETVGKLKENAANYYETARDNAANYYEAAKDKANTLYNSAASKAEDAVEEVKALPETAQSYVEDKIDQVSSNLEVGSKEFKKKVGHA